MSGPDLSPEDSALLWGAIDRAFLDTTTWNQDVEDNIEKVAAAIARKAAVRALNNAADQADRDGWARLRRAGVTRWLRARANLIEATP